MALNSTLDIDSIGGSGMGGLGGFGGGNQWPLWLLVFLGLNKEGGLFGGNNNSTPNAAQGYVAGEMQSKIDGLTQGQNNIADQIRQQTDNFRFDGLNSQISELAGIQRDATAAITSQNNDLAAQLAACCCDLKVGQQAIRTDIAMQTCDINQNTNAGIQRVVDLINVNLVEQKNDRIRELEQSAQTATLAAIVRDTVATVPATNTVDVNVLAALAKGAKVTA